MTWDRTAGFPEADDRDPEGQVELGKPRKFDIFREIPERKEKGGVKISVLEDSDRNCLK